ncbi:hypothetical protein R1sor_013421 [Riccia sorocarpa]|uniref:Lipoxygenase n=1 Tax=Riccia sorocarpa TaxID=122646 RepID=A0ABD3H945_9MARC
MVVIASSRGLSQRSKKASLVRAEQIYVSTSALKKIERSPVTHITHYDDYEEVTLKGQITLSRSIGTDHKFPTPFPEFQRKLWFTLVSSDLDKHGHLKTSARTQIQEDGADDDDFYQLSFRVPSDFGEPGALLVESRNTEEFYLQTVDLKDQDSGKDYVFACNSWVNYTEEAGRPNEALEELLYEKLFGSTHFKVNQVRIFFINKPCLPKDTPAGLRSLRALEMHLLRGNGTGERKTSDRIYDYDVYNDLGNPTASPPIIRPTLGGPGNLPYPRRGRTGRKVDQASGMEIPPPLDATNRPGDAYVPRDEDFSLVKGNRVSTDLLNGVLKTVIPSLKAKFDETPDDFDTLQDVFGLYNEVGVKLYPQSPDLQPTAEEKKKVEELLSKVYSAAAPGVPLPADISSTLTYPTAQVVQDEPMSWMSDEEFGRETIAGMNPWVIRRATKFPPTSSLPEDVYGHATDLTPWRTSSHTLLLREGKSQLQRYQIKISPSICLTTVTKDLTRVSYHLLISEFFFILSNTNSNHPSHDSKTYSGLQAIRQKRLFTIDYHDVYLPYVYRINNENLDDKRFIYAPRAFFFLTDDQQMKPVAIELSLPSPQKGVPEPQHRVFTPPKEENKYDFQWELAKLHFASVDFGFHELISHWLMSHAVVEPFIIASHRQLSAMHPISVLLEPAFVNNMRINANARTGLIAAAPVGPIENYFTPGKYSNELAGVAYDKLWRFDKVGLPYDLLERGMAEPDPSQPEGVKLVFDDYPYAKDALDIWHATKQYVTEYVKVYYKTDEAVASDEELQEWWKEIREVGHGDKKDADWWPSCKTIHSLIDIVCTIFYMAGPQHASVNFSQYTYAGFMPNRPPMTRLPIPEPNTPEYKEMLFNFEKYMLKSASSTEQTIGIQTVLNVLSVHSEDEEYLGQRLDSHWTSDPRALEVFKKFADNVQRLERMFKQRNANPQSKNRFGALKSTGYTLMYPTSEPGLTGKGIPWSVSI